jgi:hypothetical protein
MKIGRRYPRLEDLCRMQRNVRQVGNPRPIANQPAEGKGMACARFEPACLVAASLPGGAGDRFLSPALQGSQGTKGVA